MYTPTYYSYISFFALFDISISRYTKYKKQIKHKIKIK